MQKLATAAIVVRLVDYGEADRVVTLVTRELGKVAGLARGARRSGRRFGGGLALFGVGEAQLVPRRGDLWSLDSFHAARGYPGLALDVAKVAHAAYLCELTRELLPDHQRDTTVYDLLDLALRTLDGAPATSQLLRVFELQLLGRLGFGPAFDACASCGGADADRFDAQRGGLLCHACAFDPSVALPLPSRLRAALRRAQLLPLGEAPGAALFDLLDEGAAREVMQALVRQHLGRPLRSLEFIAKLNASRAATVERLS